MPPIRRHLPVDITTGRHSGKDYSAAFPTQLRRAVELLDLKMQPVADVAAIALAGGE
jgi:hypothetical protein